MNMTLYRLLLFVFWLDTIQVDKNDNGSNSAVKDLAKHLSYSQFSALDLQNWDSRV